MTLAFNLQLAIEQSGAVPAAVSGCALRDGASIGSKATAIGCSRTRPSFAGSPEVISQLSLAYVQLDPSRPACRVGGVSLRVVLRAAAVGSCPPAHRRAFRTPPPTRDTHRAIGDHRYRPLAADNEPRPRDIGQPREIWPMFDPSDSAYSVHPGSTGGIRKEHQRVRRFAPIKHLREPLIVGGEVEIAVAQWRVVGDGCPLAKEGSGFTTALCIARSGQNVSPKFVGCAGAWPALRPLWAARDPPRSLTRERRDGTRRGPRAPDLPAA